MTPFGAIVWVLLIAGGSVIAAGVIWICRKLGL
jgi:hypothetical protein